MNSLTKQKGFTLIELIDVIILVASIVLVAGDLIWWKTYIAATIGCVLSLIRLTKLGIILSVITLLAYFIQ